MSVHWGYWLGLVLALCAGGGEVWRRTVRRRRVWLGAVLEQARRESEHPHPYRPDQRVRAIQQRLSRSLGKSALSEDTRRLLEREL